MFVDVHSHVVPSGDDGAATVLEGIELCREAARRGTSVLYATPHVWPHLELTEPREQALRAAYAEMKPAVAAFGLDLRLGFELTPSPTLLEEDPGHYPLGESRFVLMELPFAGPLALAERLAAHIEAAGFRPVIAHPERADAVVDRPLAVHGYRERGWLLQVNATSLLGRHGPERGQLGWRLVEEGLADLVASDGHRASRPATLDAAYDAVKARVGEDAAGPLFSGTALTTGDGLDLAQRREAV